jgi:indole-3-glycerol phosphate synthase
VSDLLQKILATKRNEVEAAKRRISIDELRAAAADSPPPRDFIAAIAAKHASGQAAVIAEIKKASPSAGEFRAGSDATKSAFAPARFAASYAAFGAACLSVLTDRGYFQGCADDLVAARAACKLPVLRKDFIVDPYQIVEARAMGADAVLFIIGAVDILKFRDWENLAGSLGMAVLAESHSAAELEQALTLKTPLIGINNRDLKRFRTDINTTLELKSAIPPGRTLVSESGIGNAEVVSRLWDAGVNTFLVGGALMSQDDPGQALADMFGTYLAK